MWGGSGSNQKKHSSALPSREKNEVESAQTWATNLGFAINCPTGRVGPTRAKSWRIVQATGLLKKRPRITGQQLESWVVWKQRTTREALQAMRKLRLRDWAEEQSKRQWRWAGHIQRRTDFRWTKTILDCFADGHAKSGAPVQKMGRLVDSVLLPEA